MPDDVDGIELCINSDGFFAIEEQPERVAVVGAGYIAVELAGNTETHPYMALVYAHTHIELLW
jgi:glutathione reductase (NADPH)